MTRHRLLALSGLPLLLAACVTGGQLRATADVVEENVKLARDQNAMQCAPVELATAEAHLAFARGELDQGNGTRADAHLSTARQAADDAVRLSKGCAKEVVVAPTEPSVIVKIEEKDTDADGLPDKDDACPEQAGPAENQGCPVQDRDGDGIPDPDDACPDEPEDRDGWRDEDGCPEPDNDQDGIPDTDDRCPDQPGPRTNQGCPVQDRDGDGISDGQDACPDEPEDRDGFQDDDGCPDLDNDEDGIPDVRDRCPDEAGPPETGGCPTRDRDGDGVADDLDRCPDEPGVAEENGCPKKYELVELKQDRIEIRQKVHFETGKWRILADSFALLDQVAQVMKDHPALRIRVEGHTDSVGSDSSNLRLSQARAESVRDYLVRQGVEPGRMEAVGFGETRPIASNNTSVGREANRRVEFVVTDR